jgi:hypothetical protein
MLAESGVDGLFGGGRVRSGFKVLMREVAILCQVVDVVVVMRVR